MEQDETSPTLPLFLPRVHEARLLQGLCYNLTACFARQTWQT